MLKSSIVFCLLPVTPANFDFHCHSTVSDGLLSPQDVARRAAANAVDLWALTDHDDLGGLLIAREVAEEAGMGFVPGVEISIEWRGVPIHIVGLGFDPADPGLAGGLDELRIGRIERARRMGDALAAIGIPGVYEGALCFVTNPSLISRAHFGRYLVSIGIARDMAGVFQNYLTPGKPGYVDHRWATLQDAIGWINGAGGVAVVAHPGRYRMSGSEMRRFLDDFKDIGGQGLEGTLGRHSPDQGMNFARPPPHFFFPVARRSVFHCPGESFFDLGQVLAPTGYA